MNLCYVNIHTHRPTGCGAELRSAGIHPWLAGSHTPADVGSLRAALAGALAGAQAVGETGLDFACGADRASQELLFRAHAGLAELLRLPVVVHCVRAFEPVMKILGGYDLPAVIFHGFIGSVQQMRRAADAGYCLSFGMRSFRSPKTVAAMRAAPLDRLFLETDDDPVGIGEVYSAAADILGMDEERLAETILGNYGRVFVRKAAPARNGDIVETV